MIRKIKLRDWKSFQETQLYIDPITFVIGTNASGKSNLIEALLFVRNLASGKNIDDSIEQVRGDGDWVIRKGQSSFRLELEIEVPGQKYFYQYKLLVVKGESGFRIAAEQLLQICAPEKGNRELFVANTDENSLIMSIPDYLHEGEERQSLDVSPKRSLMSQGDLMPVAKSLKEEVIGVAAEMKKIFLLDPIPSAMRGYHHIAAELKPDASNLAGVLLNLAEPTRRELEQRITTYLRPLPERDIKELWTYATGLQNKDAILCCVEEWQPGDPMKIDAREMSDGTLRFIAIIATLLLQPQGSLVIIEEIDNGLHPSRAKNLANVLRTLSQERGIDVICTTHNPVLIDALGVDMVPFISYVSRDAQTGCSRIDLLEEKENLIKLMSSNSVGSLMTNNKI